MNTFGVNPKKFREKNITKIRTIVVFVIFFHKISFGRRKKRDIFHDIF